MYSVYSVSVYAGFFIFSAVATCTGDRSFLKLDSDVCYKPSLGFCFDGPLFVMVCVCVSKKLIDYCLLSVCVCIYKHIK